MTIATTSQNGWPSITDYGDARLKPLPWINGAVLAGDVWTVLDWLCRRFDADIEHIVSGSSWGFSPRTIIGSTVTSNHASGTAIDLNADRHPLGKQGTFTAAQTSALHAILTETVVDAVPVIRWGGDYTGRKDEMHFEVGLESAGVTPAKVATLAGRILAAGAATLTAKRPTIKAGSTGDAVKALQRGLRLWFPSYSGTLTVDGQYGPKTAAAVAEFQRRSGLTADGIVGPDTWGELGRYGIRP